MSESVRYKHDVKTLTLTILYNNTLVLFTDVCVFLCFRVGPAQTIGPMAMIKIEFYVTKMIC